MESRRIKELLQSRDSNNCFAADKFCKVLRISEPAWQHRPDACLPDKVCKYMLLSLGKSELFFSKGNALH